MKRGLLLASQSPRRKEILKLMGIPFRVVRPHGVTERVKRGERPRDLVRRLALEKARSVSARHPQSFVLGADTVVVSRGKIFGKPADSRAAKRMLMDLRGRSHSVWTGVALVSPGNKRDQAFVEKTKVYFKAFTLNSIETYLKSPEPYDKAGAYNIQGTARAWVEKWEGDYFNIVGLPVGSVLKLLENMNLAETR